MSYDSNADDVLIKATFDGKNRAFKLVVRLKVEQAMLRESFYLLDQLLTFYPCAYRGDPNTSNFAYTCAAFRNNNKFCVSAGQPEGASNSHFVPHVMTAGDNANPTHTSGIDNNACDNLWSPYNSADNFCPPHS